LQSKATGLTTAAAGLAVAVAVAVRDAADTGTAVPHATAAAQHAARTTPASLLMISTYPISARQDHPDDMTRGTSFSLPPACDKAGVPLSNGL
jgi:hypothetical protein